MKDTMRATMVQMSTRGSGDIIDRMKPFFSEAAENKSDIIVFPEYILGANLTIEDEPVKEFRKLAAAHSMYAITGFIEKHGTRWSTTALLVDRQGEILGRYLKTHPASGDPPYFWPPVSSSPSVSEAQGILGGGFKTFALDFGTIGIIQCYDGYFPEAWGCTAYMGAEVIFWINGRDGMVENHYCLTAAECYGAAIGANISDGFNTGFVGPSNCVTDTEGKNGSYGQLYPATKEKGDQAVHAHINLLELRRQKKHLRQMHQRRPELYGLLTKDVTIWQNYPEIPWVHEEAEQLVNKSQL